MNKPRLIPHHDPMEFVRINHNLLIRYIQATLTIPGQRMPADDAHTILSDFCIYLVRRGDLAKHDPKKSTLDTYVTFLIRRSFSAGLYSRNRDRRRSSVSGPLHDAIQAPESDTRDLVLDMSIRAQSLSKRGLGTLRQLMMGHTATEIGQREGVGAHAIYSRIKHLKTQLSAAQ